MPIRTLFVANRGEIAVRIIRAAKGLGIRTVQAVSSADREMLAARMADEIAEIGPPHAARLYLNKEAIVAAAVASGADAVHPGYGFLSENASFAAMVESAGLIFVGPRPETIRTMGDKAAAREMAARAGVPTTPGSAGRIEDAGAARRAAEAVGYPVMIKAAAGGGGRGIRIAGSPAELDAQIPQASAEALAAFGDGGLYLERFVPRARHVEVQVLGDGEATIHLYERECSLQRRRQKVWEEAAGDLPLDGATRSALRIRSAARKKRRLPGRWHARVSLRRDDRGLLFHRDEYPHSGRAPRDRDGHWRRPRSVHASHCGRRSAPLPPIRDRLPRPCDRGPHQRRGPRQGFMPRSALGASFAFARRMARACASTPCSTRAMSCRPFTIAFSAS